MSSPRLLGIAVLAVAVLLFRPFPLSGQAGTPACSDAEHRLFDFWIGEWDVYRPDGRKVGHNTITAVMDGCVLHESYDGSEGYHGESFNVFDASRGVWHQTWVDNGGLLLLLEGGSAEGGMVLEGETVDSEGTRTRHRITWSRIDGDPDRVRQLWERSTDGGGSWTVAFDGEYRRAGT